jgi:DNA-binding response OmpR family regulator
MSQDERTRILIADNDEDVLVALERTLEDEGYETAVAVSGDVAFQSLATGTFDLLVLDDYLSDNHCIQVLTHFQRAGMKPLVVVTYHDFPSRAEQEQLRSLGVSTLVNKLAHTELVRTVHYLLRPLGRASDAFGSMT